MKVCNIMSTDTMKFGLFITWHTCLLVLLLDLSGNKMVLAFWAIQIYNFVQIHLTYSNISTFFYLAYIFVVISLPVVTMVIARILLGFILIIHNNQELIKTIKKILEVFPEGIIIQSFDKVSNKLILQFSNEAASKEILNYENLLGKPIDEDKLNIVLKTSDNIKWTNWIWQKEDLESYSLPEFLQFHTYSAQVIESEVWSSVEVCSKEYNEETDSLKSQFYNVKTLWTRWKNNDNSFIHVFVNTTAVKKFEMEKSRNEVMQLMFSSVSHEFRTPINAFTNSIALIEWNYQCFLNKLNESKYLKIKDELLPKRHQESNEKFFKICKISTTSLMSLVEDILDLAKIEAGTFKLNEEPFEIETLANDIKYIFEFQWNQKGILFRIDVDKEIIKSSFWSDIGRIKQILINLISNALKFTMEGRITLQIMKENIFNHNAFQRSKWLKFKVHDTGIGIDEKEVSNLFKLFGTINQHQNKLNSRGTGLGLAISKKIVESLGGTIRLKSIKNVGTKVTFTVKENLCQVEEQKHDSSKKLRIK